MILAQHGMIASAMIHRSTDGVDRVIIARTDGMPFFDDEALRSRDTGAAVTAAMHGIAGQVASFMCLGQMNVLTIHCEDRLLLLYPFDELHFIAVLASTGVNQGAVAGAVERFRRQAGVSHTAEHDKRVHLEAELRERQRLMEGQPAVR